MNSFNYFLLRFFVLLLVIFSPLPTTIVHGQTTAAPALSLPSTAILTGTASIQNATIISQKDNTVTLFFNIKNKEIIQTGIKYGIKLVSEGPKPTVVDEKIYDESLTLLENSTTPKQIIYAAPKYLNGNYTLVVSNQNESGFPF